LAGTRSERVVARLALRAFADLAGCAVTLTELKGPGTIPSAAWDGYLQTYRGDGRAVSEMALVPLQPADLEKDVTLCVWLRLAIPAAAPPGVYTGKVTIAAEPRRLAEVPIALEIYPFRLEERLPAAFGMYYREPAAPALPAAARGAKLREQLRWMREIGFTSFTIPPPAVKQVAPERNRVVLECDPFWYELARETGMAAAPDQRLMTSSLSLARNIGKRLPGMSGLTIDRNPGIELRQPAFKPLYLEALRQYREFLDRLKLPVAVEAVDEPRAMPNPWNRNLADTLTYADLLRGAGLPTFVTPMQDREGDLDYTVLVEHADIISTHGWSASAELMRRTRSAGRILWIYNNGCDRLSWGFFPWRIGARGRWEWHFCWPEDTAVGGYPGREWYNPFTGMDGLAPAAPAVYRGALLFKSDFFRIAQGISDYAYLVTLEKAIAAKRAAQRNLEIVGEAERFLAELRQSIPAALPLNAAERAPLPLDEWRARIAGFLKQLATP
jgi:hypothetical protein